MTTEDYPANTRYRSVGSWVRHGVPWFIGFALLASPVALTTGSHGPGNGGSGGGGKKLSANVQAQGHETTLLAISGGSDGQTTTVYFTPPAVCQGAAPNDETVGYYDYQQGLYQDDVALCNGVVSQSQYDEIGAALSKHLPPNNSINSTYVLELKKLEKQVVSTETDQVCSAIVSGGYFDPSTESSTSPYDDNHPFAKKTSYASTAPWSSFADASSYYVDENAGYEGVNGYGLCAVRYSILAQQPPTVEHVNLTWYFNGNESTSISAPAPTFGTWTPNGAFGATVQQLAGEAASDAGVRSNSISMHMPTWPMGTFADPKRVADGLQTSLATVPWPANTPLAIDPTGDPNSASGSLNGSGPIDVSGTATVSQAGTTRTIHFGPVQVGTWSVSGSATAPLTGYYLSGPTLDQSESCTLGQVNTSAELFGKAPSVMNNAFANPSYDNVSALQNLLPSSCSITYDGNAYPYNENPIGPDGDAPVWAQGVYGAPSGSASATITQTKTSIPVGGVSVPIQLPDNACTMNFSNGTTTHSSNGWCSLTSSLGGFRTAPSLPLYLHVAPFNAIAVPTIGS